MKRKRCKTKVAEPEIELSPLQQAIHDVWQAIMKVPRVDHGILFSHAANYLVVYANHPFVLKRVIKLLEKIEKKRPFTESLLRRQVRFAWVQLIDSEWKLPTSERELPTYSELTSKVCELGKREWSDNLSRNVRYLADDLQLPMKSWRRK